MLALTQVMGGPRSVKARALLASVLLVVAVSVVPAAPARAETDKREVKARQLFAVGKYAEALEIFGNLYAETLHPTYLRNVGRCYQNLGEPDKAISSFSEYLRQFKNITPAQREQVEGYVREMEELKRKRQKEAEAREAPSEPKGDAGKKGAPPKLAAPDPDASPRTRASKPLVAGADPDAQVTRKAKGGDDKESSPFYTRWWFWTAAAALIGGGVATVVLLRPRTPDVTSDFGSMSANPR